MLTLIAGALIVWFQAPVSQPDAGHQIALDLQAGKLAEAKDLLRRALKQTPRDARLWTLNGLTLVQLKQPEAALDSFQRALALAPRYLPALEGAAQLEFQAGSSGAEALLNDIVKARPEDPTTHGMLAELAFRQGDCEKARDEYLLSAPGAEVKALQEFGSCLVSQKRVVEALPVYRQLLALQPGSEPATYSLAVAQFLAGKYAEVVETLRRAAETETPNADSLELLAETYQFTSERDRSMGLLERAIALHPRVSAYYTDAAYLCLANGSFQRGIEILDEGLHLIPEAAPLYVARGLLNSELGEFEKAERDFQTASQIDPNVELGSAAQGLSELQQNDLPRAEATARQRLRLHPDDALLHYVLAEALAKEGSTKEAISSAETAVRLKPDLTVARNVLARLYLQSGRIKEAIEQSRAVYRTNPSDQTALYHLILALQKGNQTEEIPTLLKQLARLKEQSRGQDEFGKTHQLLKP